METTTVRITKGLLQELKTMKEVLGVNTYEDTISTLVKDRLGELMVRTSDGYIPVGAVVKDGESVLVIKSILGDKVIFNDGTYALNGGGAVWRLKLLADSVENYDEGRQIHD